MKKEIKIMLLTMLVLLSSYVLYAQGGVPGDDPGEDPDTQQVPIDGGISLLIAAGVAYGAKKAHDARKGGQKTDK